MSGICFKNNTGAGGRGSGWAYLALKPRDGNMGVYYTVLSTFVYT